MKRYTCKIGDREYMVHPFKIDLTMSFIQKGKLDKMVLFGRIENDKMHVVARGEYYEGITIDDVRKVRDEYLTELGKKVEDIVIMTNEPEIEKVSKEESSSKDKKGSGCMAKVETWCNDKAEKEEQEDMSKVLIKKIQKFVNKVTYLDFEEAILSKVMGQPEADKLVFRVYYYLKRIAKGKPANDFSLLAGPSGSGKTELFRTMRAYFKDKIPGLPVIEIDIQNLTETGFKGKDPSDLFIELINAKTEGIGLVWIDEIDKKLMPSYDSREQNVNKKAMDGILKIVEGTSIVAKDGAKTDTNNTFFVGMGSFDEYRITKREVKNSIGFGGRTTEKPDTQYMPITVENLLDMGAFPEFIGRIRCIVNYQPVSEEAKYKIARSIFEKEVAGYEESISAEDRFIDEVVARFDPKTGCRSFRKHIEDTIQKAVITLYKQNKDSLGCSIVINATQDFSFVNTDSIIDSDPNGDIDSNRMLG